MRGRAAALLSLAAAASAAVHVAIDTPGDMRDWRQTLPLAAVLGAALGWALNPRSAVGGAAAGAAGLVGFAALWLAGHAGVEALGGGSAAAAAADAAPRVLGAVAGPAGAAAVGFSALAGWIAGRRAPPPR